MSDLQSAVGLEGKAALVIGGGQGIGEACARMLALAGCDVAVLDSVTERAERVASEIEGLGRSAKAITADISVESEAERAVAEAADRFPHLEKLVTVVGGAAWAPLLEMPSETWDRQLSVNLRYVFLTGRAFARSLIARGRPGAITCTSSVEAAQSSPNHAAYGVAKAGLDQLVRTMAVEWAPHNIRVNAVAPGPIATPRLLDLPERIRDGENLPMRRRGTPDEVGKAVLFLSSELASFVTAETLHVDGGMLATSIVFLPRRETT